jgi:small ligand-binding sensory domain FIST
MAEFRFASACSTKAGLEDAVADVADQLSAAWSGAIDLAVVFISHEHAEGFDRLPALLRDRLGIGTLLGCCGESIVADGREIELGPALSIQIARLPGVSILPMHLEFERTLEGGTFLGWPDRLIEGWPEQAGMILLGEPWSFPADKLLDRMHDDAPGVTLVGGMASGGRQPGEHALFLDDAIHHEGAVAVLLEGPVEITTVVSQGCRPIGTPMVVTRCQQNVIFELGGKPALQRLKEVFDGLSERDQELVKNGLHVGRAISEYRDSHGRGDFRVSNLVGYDRNVGAIAIGDIPRLGQTVQFHVRDADTADEDLRELLAPVAPGVRSGPAGGLLFTCNGRGTRLFPGPDHDAGAIRASLGELPLTGFFAAGEIGPIGGRSFLHGFTASLAVLRPRAESKDSA